MLDKPSTKIEEKLKRIPAKYYWLVAAIISTVTYLFIFSVSNMLPYGYGTVIRLDMYPQYMPCIEYLMEVIKGNHGYWFSWSNFCGFNNSGMFAYLCLSPFNILFLLFGKSNALYAVTAVVVLKCGTAAALMQRFLSYFLRSNRISTVIFAIAYSLCGYQIAYYCVMNFTDSVYLLPLIMLAITKLLREGKVWPLILSYFLLFFSCFYMGYMVGIGSFILGIGYYIYTFSKRDLRGNIRVAAQYVCAVLTALLLTAIIWLPAVLELFSFSEDNYNNPLMWKTNIFLILNNLFMGEYQDMNGYTPYVYCGIATLILSFAYFGNKRIKKKERIYSAAVVVTVLLMMVVPVLNKFMHAFDTPQMFGYRYSFILSFVLCVIACRQSAYYRQTDRYTIGLFVFYAVFIFASSISLYIYRDGVNNCNKFYVAIINAVFIALWFAVFYLGKKRRFESFTFNSILILLLICELSVNGAVVYVKSSDLNYGSDEYRYARIARDNTLEKMELPGENEFFRSEMISCIAPNAGLEDGFYSLTSFNSAAPKALLDAFHKLGISEKLHSLFARGMSPFMRAVMSVRYYSNYDIEVFDDHIWTENNANDLKALYYHYNGDHSSSIVKENEKYLSLGFMADDAILNVRLTDSPFENQNSIASAMCGENVKMYEDAAWDVKSDNGKLVTYNRGQSKELDKITTGLSMENGYLFLRNTGYETNAAVAPTEEAYAPENSMQFTFTAKDNGKPVYGYFGRGFEYKSFGVINTLDETDILENSGLKHEFYDCSIKTLGHNAEGDFEETVLFPEGINKDYCEQIYFADYNEDEFNKAFDILSQNQLKINTFKDGYVKGEIEAKKAGVMFTGIPYIDGWKAYVDGVEVKPIALIEGAFLGIELEKGEHSIELKYTAPGCRQGAVISLVGLIMLAGVGVIEYRANKRKNPA